VVGGWTIAYIGKSFGGEILTSDAKVLGDIFNGFITDPALPLLYHGLFAGLTLAVVIGGVQKGIENLSKFLMPALFVLMLVLIARALTLPGAVDGLLYFLTPDFSKVSGSMLVDAMGLAFFSLSLGMGIMITYGSYVDKEANLLSSSLWVIALTVLTCFLAGLMVLPAVFAFGFDPSAGPGLTFITMPAVFAQMVGGQLFAVLFFFLLLVAALTSSVSLLEVVVSFVIDEFKVGRKAAALGVSLLVFLLGIPASLSLGIWSEYTVFGLGFFDLLDFLTSKLLMPVGEVLLAIFVGWKVWPVIEAELSAGARVPAWLRAMRGFCRYVAPALIAGILVHNL
jgi:NSS family neurotransmitter:Na+ symporter